MNNKIKIETNKEELNLIRKAVANYLEELENHYNGKERESLEYAKIEKIYNKLVELTFNK